jgi:hypothetical protein
MRWLLCFTAMCGNIFVSNAQSIDQERTPTIGAYAGVVPMRNYLSWVSAGINYDLPFKTTKSLSVLTGVTFMGRINTAEYHLTFASGLSWKIQRNRFVFRPSLQLGYLYIAQGSMEGTGYRLHGLYLKGSTEYLWQIQRCELGLHLNYGIGMGPTWYASG